MAGNREGVRLCVEMTLVIMDKAERWLNDFLFASVNTNFMRPELFSKRLFVIAEDKNNTGVMRLTNLHIVLLPGKQSCQTLMNKSALKREDKEMMPISAAGKSW